MGDGTVKRDYIYIDDVVDAFTAVLQLKKTKSENIYNIGGGNCYSLNQIIEILESEIGVRARVAYGVPRSFDVPVNRLDISRAELDLSWSPKISLRDGINKTINYLKALQIES